MDREGKRNAALRIIGESAQGGVKFREHMLYALQVRQTYVFLQAIGECCKLHPQSFQCSCESRTDTYLRSECNQIDLQSGFCKVSTCLMVNASA
jgi:hypothetical protein